MKPCWQTGPVTAPQGLARRKVRAIPPRADSLAVPALPTMARSILLVDDDDGFRSLAVGTLRAAGLERVYEASTAAGALTAAAELRPDAALIDIGLPDGDGFQLARELAALPHPPRVVLISADVDAADDAAARRAGAVGFVAKEDLEGARLGRLLGRR